MISAAAAAANVCDSLFAKYGTPAAGRGALLRREPGGRDRNVAARAGLGRIAMRRHEPGSAGSQCGGTTARRVSRKDEAPSPRTGYCPLRATIDNRAAVEPAFSPHP